MSVSTINIEVRRYHEDRKACLGRLFLDDVYICDTIEPPFRAEYGAINYGCYIVKLLWSSRFHRVQPFVMVDGRSGIEFHTGNLPEQTKGCILVGYNRPYTGHSVQYSKVAMSVLMENLQANENVVFNLKVVYDTDFSNEVYGL